MGRRMAVSQAAKLLGLGRRELQQLIRNGDLDTFEGRVDLDALRRQFPELAVHPITPLEELQLIRSTAFSRRVRETVVPEQDALASRLKRREVELAVARGRADKLEKLLREMACRLGEMQNGGTAAEKAVAADLCRWLLDRMQE